MNMSKKKETLLALYRSCKESGQYVFDNKKVREICNQTGFGNPFDVTKIDCSELLPDQVIDDGYCVVHLGAGRHMFMKAIDIWFHSFENMLEEDTRDWMYVPSLLNNTDTSESGVISMVYNQLIIQDFLYNDFKVSPRIYMSRRSKITDTYNLGNENISIDRLQFEVDATFELDGVITTIECKKGFPKDFSVYQLYYPFLYYYKLIKNAVDLNCCYLLRGKGKEENTLRIYLYKFMDSGNIDSINLIKKSEFKLLDRD